MNLIQNMLFLTPEVVAAHGEGVTVRNNDTGVSYTVSVVADDEYSINVYTVNRNSDGAVANTQIFDNVIKYVAGAKPF